MKNLWTFKAVSLIVGVLLSFLLAAQVTVLVSSTNVTCNNFNYGAATAAA
ncbi:MAG: hypothetical protein JKX73_11935 [Flavobacteriales bacterium]|nr:hypothetical protein [Flavobacteriales bacterium]